MWNKGYIRVTGPVRNLRSFVLDKLVALDRNDQIVRDAWQIVVDDDGRFWTRNVSPVNCFLRGMRKCIINTDNIVACARSDDAVDTIQLPFRKPGDICATAFLEIAKRYGLDLQVYIGNYKDEISHTIRIENGEVAQDETNAMECHQPRIIAREMYA